MISDPSISPAVPPQPGNTTSCSVFDSLMVSPFQTSNSYSFSDTCEHFLVSSCNGLVEFAVTVDFLSANISNGRIGVRYGERRFVYQEDGTIDTRGEVPINIDGNTAEYEGQIFITEDANGIVLQFQSVGVEIFITSAAFEMNVNLFSPLGTTCGLCGTQEGVLLYSDQQTTADIANEAQVRGFVASHLVPARDHFLRGVRRECGEWDLCCGKLLITVYPISVINKLAILHCFLRRKFAKYYTLILINVHMLTSTWKTQFLIQKLYKS